MESENEIKDNEKNKDIQSSSSSSESSSEEIIAFDPIHFFVKDAEQNTAYAAHLKPEYYETRDKLIPFGDHHTEVIKSITRLETIAPETSYFYRSMLTGLKRDLDEHDPLFFICISLTKEFYLIFLSFSTLIISK